MDNFRFCVGTDIYFGEGQLKHLAGALKPHGKNVLLTYGGGSIKRGGLYDQIMTILLEHHFTVVELSGIEPNPRITSVEKGVALCKEHAIDVILAVGGGSTIDCSKAIASGRYYEGVLWDMVKNPQTCEKSLPLVTVLTMSATGSEMNRGSVISNPETNEKVGFACFTNLPQASILDPTFTYSLPAYQSASGVADIMSHTLESYFKATQGAFIQDRLAEGILKTCIAYGPKVIESPEDYEARANLMWASSLALNGLLGSGKNGGWTCHPIEHQLSAYYDITHGVGLAILTSRWMRYILSDTTVQKFVEYAVNVWGIANDVDAFAVAHAGIDKTEAFFKSMQIPMTLREVGIKDKSRFNDMARQAVQAGLTYSYVALNEEDVVAILEACF